MREKTEYRAGFRVVLPDGSIRYQYATGHPVTNDAGDLVEFIGASMDMTEHWLAATERSLAEEALRKSEERWRAVFENSAIGVALTDQSGRFLATNSAFQKMLGYTEEEIVTLTFLEFTHEDYRESNWQLVTELLEGKRTTVSDREAVPTQGRQLDLGKQQRVPRSGHQEHASVLDGALRRHHRAETDRRDAAEDAGRVGAGDTGRKPGGNDGLHCS